MGAALRKMGVLKKKKKNKKIGDSMLMILPEEVLTKILLTLPIKSLMLLRCVSKSLNTFLRTPYFIDLHMNQQNECILISDRGRRFLSFHSYESLNEISPHFVIPYFDSKVFYVSWPCNGLLVCVGVYTCIIVLCNPTTREVKLLPSSPFHGGLKWVVDTVGLGFDTNKHDYKIVITLKNSNSNYKTELYNLSSNSWKQIDHDLPLTYTLFGIGGVLVNGVLHWIGRRGNVYVILSFNVRTEMFQDINLPYAISHAQDIAGKIPTIINDCLALFVFNGYSKPKFVEIWIMKEDSWAKQVSIYDVMDNCLNYPCLLWKNEAILMVTDNGNLSVCNIDNQRITDTGIHSVYYVSLRVMIYKESLVSIK